MQADYVPFIDRMIDRYEGPYGWNRRDPGGPTKYGVTCYDLAEHRHEQMDDMERWASIVKSMPKSEAEDIYQTKYAGYIHFNDLPAGIDCVMMDYAVNSGRLRPIRVACALFKLPVHGDMTPGLLGAIKTCEPEWFIRSMNAERLHFMHQIRKGAAWAEFGHGWQHRVDDLTEYSLHIAHPATQPAPALPISPTDVVPKAQHVDPDPSRKISGGGAAVSGGGLAAFAGGVHPWMIAAGIAVVVVAGIAYLVWSQGHADRANAAVVLPPDVTPRSPLT